jgi:hypothetical protein
LDTPCVIFPGFKDRDGYGYVRHEGQMRPAHRVAYCKDKKIPLSSIKGLVVRHMCDNPSCVFPLHLLLGTQLDNVRDREERGRRKPPVGELNGRSKLTQETAQEIRDARERGVSVKELASKYGIHQSTVYATLSSKTWTPTQLAAA